MITIYHLIQGQEFRNGLAGLSGSGSLTGCQLRLQSSDGLTETRSASKIDHLPGWQINPGCLWEASVPPLMDFFVGKPECPYNVATGFPQSKGSNRE